MSADRHTYLLADVRGILNECSSHRLACSPPQKTIAIKLSIQDFLAALNNNPDRHTLSINKQQLAACLGIRLLLEGNNLFNTDSRLHGDHDTIFSSTPGLANLIGKSLWVGGKVEVRLLVSAFVHESELVAINVDNFPLGAVDNGDSGSVGGRDHIFELLSSEDVRRGEVALGVAVLSRLGDRDGQDLAGLSLDHHVSE